MSTRVGLRELLRATLSNLRALAHLIRVAPGQCTQALAKNLFRIRILTYTPAVLKILVCLVFLIAACGSDSKPLLHLDGYDVSERDMQLEFRAVLSTAGPSALLACRQFSDMTIQEAREYLKRVTTPSQATPPSGSTLKTGQVAEPKSYDKAVEIFLAECKRLSGAG